MMRSLWTAASGMRAQQTNVDTIANNLANVNTIGYKTQEATFKSLLYQNLQSTSTNNAGENKPVAAEVGLGTRTAAITAIFRQGNITDIDDPFCMAIEGDGFFQVKDASGQTLYTRDGSFIVSPTEEGNYLCTSDGYYVLDQFGNNIVLPTTYMASDLQVTKEGVLGFPGADGNVVPLTGTNAQGQTYNITFGLVQFNNPAGLTRESGNNYAVSVASGDPVPEGTANAKPSKVHQKHQESSNVDVANEIVNLIVAQRAYEMNSKAIQATDDMMQQANNLR
ncbi:MAG: flagellar hook-basal body protein [Lachnospiraceae bacterium]|nr:flagellar hook-basal body protein [Lachnospiraceae bacterium]